MTNFIKKHLNIESVRNCNRNCSTGQAMVLTIVMIGGIFLSATAIAGLLIFFQLQQATDFGNSAMAVFAADGAMEEATYRFLFDEDLGECFPDPCQIVAAPFTNGATGLAEILISPLDQADGSTIIKSFGWDAGKRLVRSLENTFLINP